MVLPESGGQIVRGKFALDFSALTEARQVVFNTAQQIYKSMQSTSASLKQAADASVKTGSTITASMKSISDGVRKAKNEIEQFNKVKNDSRVKNEQLTNSITPLKAIADGFRNARLEAEAFNKTNLGVIRNGLQGIANSFKFISLAAGGFIVKGLQSADTVEQITIRFQGLVGSEAEAEALMERIGERAQELGQPIRAAQQAAAALFPTLKGNVDLLDTYVGLASRLAAVNPQEGLAGAAFSIREAVTSGGTDLVSLAERFNVSKRQLREEIEKVKATGVDELTAFAIALDKVLNGLGITEETARRLSRTLGVTVRVALEELSAAMGDAFTPLAETLTPIIRDLAQFIRELRQSNPELLKFASLGALIVAGIAPVSFAIAKIIDAIRLLRSVASSPIALKVAVVGGAIAAGIQTGREVVQSIAKSADDPLLNRQLASVGSSNADLKRVQSGEDPLKIAFERFKQVIVIIADALLAVAKALTTGGAFILNAFDQVINVLKLAGTFLTEGFAGVQNALGGFVTGIADLLSGVFDTSALRNTGQDIQTSANTARDQAQQDRRNLQARLAQGFALPENVERDIETTFTNLRQSIIGGLTDFLFPVQQAGDEAASQLQSVGETLADAVKTTPEILEAFKEFQADLKEIADEFAKRRDELEAEKNKQLAAAQAQATEQQVAATQDRIEREAKLHADARKAELEAVEKLNTDLDKLRRDRNRGVLLAAARLDAFAVFAEQQRFRDAKKERKLAYDDEIKTIQEREAEGLNEINAAYGKRIIEINNQLQKENQQILDRNKERLDQLNTQEQEALTKREQQFLESYNKLAEEAGLHQDRMLGIQDEGQAALEESFLAWFDRMKTAIDESVIDPLTGQPINGSSSGQPPVIPVGGDTAPVIIDPRTGAGVYPDAAGTSAANPRALFPPEVARQLNRAVAGGRAGTFGGNVGSQIARALAPVANQRSVSLNNQQHFAGTQNLSAEQLESMMERVLIKLLEKV